MNIRPIIKKNARESLKHHWGRAIGILLFLFAVNAVFLLLEQLFYYLLSMNGTVEPALVVDLFRGQLRVTWSMALVTLTFALVSFVLTTPLMFGMTKWYFHQVGGERPSLLTLFTYFYSIRDLARSLALRVMLGVRVLLWGALFGLPSAVLAFGIEAAAGYGGLAGGAGADPAGGRCDRDHGAAVVLLGPAVFSGGIPVRLPGGHGAPRHDPGVRPDHEGEPLGRREAVSFLPALVSAGAAGGAAAVHGAVSFCGNGHQRPGAPGTGRPEPNGTNLMTRKRTT